MKKEKLKIGFWHDIEDFKYWKDGLWAALRILRDDFDFVLNESGDINLIWTGSYGKHIAKPTAKGKSIWLYAGGSFIQRDADITVVEDVYSYEQFKKIGVETSIAFGTNTDLFKPMELEKKWDVILPGAFAAWKRHDRLVEWVKESKIPLRVLVVGHKQRVETECYKICEDAGFDVMDQVTPKELAKLYNQSKSCWIPADVLGGCQRTLYEAMACGIPTRVNTRNERLLQMQLFGHRSHHYYANKLRDIIWSLSMTLPSVLAKSITPGTEL